MFNSGTVAPSADNRVGIIVLAGEDEGGRRLFY